MTFVIWARQAKSGGRDNKMLVHTSSSITNTNTISNTNTNSNTITNSNYFCYMGKTRTIWRLGKQNLGLRNNIIYKENTNLITNTNYFCYMPGNIWGSG